MPNEQDAEAHLVLSYPKLMVGPIVVTSVVNVLLSLASIGLEIAALYFGHGIWCGVFYLAAGVFGLVITIQRPTTLRLQLTMVLTCLAVLFAVVATGLSASIASQYSHNDKDEDEDCDKSFKSLYHQSRRIGIDCDDDDINSGVEWALMGVSLAALLNNIVAASLVFYGMRFPVNEVTRSTSISNTRPPSQHVADTSNKRSSVAEEQDDYEDDPPPPYSASSNHESFEIKPSYVLPFGDSSRNLSSVAPSAPPAIVEDDDVCMNYETK